MTADSITSSTIPLDTQPISVQVTRDPVQIEAAQRLRYQVFYEEFAAKPNHEMAVARLDFDDYDAYADHLIVIDHAKGDKIVGTYRLLQQDAAKRIGQFYSSDEYDLTPLLNSKHNLLELGRSCVMPDYRTKSVMNLLWEGIAEYITENDIGIMFGCASLHSTDIKSISLPLSYLHHYHLAPEDIRTRALKGRYINMDIIPKDEYEAKRGFNELPPLIKGYLRVGAVIGDGAFIDHQFNTTDVCIVMDTRNLSDRYRKHFERKMQKEMPGKNDEGVEQ
ncbi:MAG: GNAT family N-acetyltransferase [Bdellovibrionales bacterium]